MEVKSLYDPEPAPERQFEYGGFWIRFVAMLIDSLILMVASGVLLLIFRDAEFNRQMQHDVNVII